MGRPLRIISIDGTRGVGKTSQIAMLSRHFKTLGMSVSTMKMTDGEPIQSGIIAVKSAESILNQGPNHMVIFDGSIARPMVGDIVTGMSPTKLLDKFKELLQAYERIDHQYGVASLLLVMDDMVECNYRIEKFRRLTGQEPDEYFDINIEHEVVSGMRFFNNHIASKNINFQVLDLLPHQSMLDINKSLLTKLAEKYDFPKPQRDPNDW